MSRRVDAVTLVERVLIADAARAGVTVGVVASGSTRWASATFVGARHRLTLALTPGGDAADGTVTWLDGLADADLPLRGHLVADLTVVEREVTDSLVTAIVEVLTVEEA